MRIKIRSFSLFKQKRKLRIYISNTYNPAKPDAEDSEGSIASWELRVEGKLLEDVSQMWISVNMCTAQIFTGFMNSLLLLYNIVRVVPFTVNSQFVHFHLGI